MTEALECTGEHVVIVGGANSAGQAATFLARFAAKVTIAIRGPSLERVDVALLDQPARRDPERRGAHLHATGRLHR